MNLAILIKTDVSWPRLSAAVLLLLVLTGCNDGGIVGTGSGTESAADKHPAEMAGSAEPANDASLSGLPTTVQQREICNSISTDAPARLLGLATTLSVSLANNSATEFSCVWQPTPSAGESTTGKVSVTIESDTALWNAVINDSSGKYLGPDPSIFNGGYRVHSVDECHSGIVIPPDDGRTLILGYEDMTACSNGTDQPDLILKSLKELGEDALQTIRKILGSP